MTVSVLWLFLTLPWVGLQCVIVLFPGHIETLYLFEQVHKAALLREKMSSEFPAKKDSIQIQTLAKISNLKMLQV